MRTPHHYRQFALSLGKESLYIFSKFNPFNADTPLIRTLSMGPSVSVLTGFDGMCFILSTALLICDEISCGICQQWMLFEIYFLKSHHCLISELLLQFYLCLLIFEIPPLLNIRVAITVLLVPSYFVNIVSFFRRKMQRGKFCLTRSVRKLN